MAITLQQAVEQQLGHMLGQLIAKDVQIENQREEIEMLKAALNQKPATEEK